MLIRTVILGVAWCVSSSVALADPGYLYQIAGISCAPGSQTIDNNVHVTQAGNVRFDKGRTGTFYLFCPITFELDLAEAVRMTALISDEDGHGPNQISVALRRIDRRGGGIRTHENAALASNRNCSNTGAWQECSVTLNREPDFRNHYYFFQVSVSRTDASRNVVFGGIRLESIVQ